MHPAPIPVLAPLCASILDTLTRIAGDPADRRVTVPVDDLLPLAEGDRPAVESALAELEAADRAVRWDAPAGTPGCRPGGEVVTLSASIAHSLGLKLNDRSTRWQPAHAPAKSPCRAPRPVAMVRGRCAYEVSEDALPGGFDQKIDHRQHEPRRVAEAVESVGRTGDGWRRPLHLHGSGSIWPMDGPGPEGFIQDRWPYSNSPVYRDKEGEPRRISPSAKCPACSGQPMPTGACLVCEASGQDHQLSRLEWVERDRLAGIDRRKVKADRVPNAAIVQPYDPEADKPKVSTSTRMFVDSLISVH